MREMKGNYVLTPLFFLALSTVVRSDVLPQEATQSYVGCFKDSLEARDLPFESQGFGAADSVDTCIQQCLSHFFRYAGLQDGRKCFCGSKYGSLGAGDDSSCDIPCHKNSSQKCGGVLANNIYDTGQRASGPPSSLKVSNISETGLHVSWGPPEAPNGVIHSYIVSAELDKSYSRYKLPPVMSWTYTADIRNADILDLHPGSEYRILVQAEMEKGGGSGVPAYLSVETHVGCPMIPNEPMILARDEKEGRILIHIDEGISDNGPVTGYRVVVVLGLAEFDSDLLYTYQIAMEKGLSYYIAADLESEAGNSNFTVGDGQRYGTYDNVRLDSVEDVQVALGVVSSFENHACTSYSVHRSEKKIMIVPVAKEEGLESGLVAAIVVCSVLLLLVILAYFAARRFAPQRRGASRMEDPQEMCLQGPMIEVENYGYIPEDEEENKVNHYDRLKKVLWDIPRNFLDIQSNNVLGNGEFGTVVKGTVLQSGYPLPTSVQCIEDGALSATTKRAMLQELATLIKCGTGNHSNVIRLLGTCESPEILYIVLEYHPASLKDILLESRTLERPSHDRDLSSVCSLPQQAFLQMGIGIAQGMLHLANNKVIHKQLSSWSVLMADGMVPKITNFGIAKCHRPNMVLDCTRWMAREVFRSQHYTMKSDIWSMGCLLWEMAALGGTLYNGIPTAEVAARVMRGLRPPHLSHISDDFYQLMLQCWQLDLDERPNFEDIISTLCDLINSSEIHLDWSVVPGFSYEQYLSELELLQQR